MGSMEASGNFIFEKSILQQSYLVLSEHSHGYWWSVTFVFFLENPVANPLSRAFFTIVLRRAKIAFLLLENNSPSLSLLIANGSNPNRNSSMQGYPIVVVKN